MPPVPKPKTCHDPAYLQWVRETQRCRVEGPDCNYAFGRTGPDGTRMVEPNHLRHRNDDSCVTPLCPGHHRTNTISWHHGQATFCWHYGLTREQLVQEAEDLYRAWKENQ